MDLALIALIAFIGSLLTLISGFGLGTLLLPVFTLFFSLEVAIGLTAIVHLLNNVFKFSLLFKWTNIHTFLWFGLPSILGAYLGVLSLERLVKSKESVLFFGFESDLLSIIIGLLIIFFSLTELFPKILNFKINKGSLIPGGILSGFFGGLSGHQGALRSVFLIKANLSKEAYIATGVAIALLVDLTRIPIYLQNLPDNLIYNQKWSLSIAVLSAFAGAVVGKKMIKKVTLNQVKLVVAILMILIGLKLIFGL